MSEEGTAGTVSEESAVDSNSIGSDKLRSKLGITRDENILLLRRPSFFAFMPAYLVGALVLLFHLAFGWAGTFDTADQPWYIVGLIYFLRFGSIGDVGFVAFMLVFTWLNRVINSPVSGRWMTTVLLIISFTPIILNLDNLLTLFGSDKEYIPIDFNYTIFGIVWVALMWSITLWYQRSFLYAVTSHRIIHYQAFIYERDGLRFLHEDIIGIHKRRTPIGALFGYATIYCNIGDQSHVSTETTGGAVAVPGEAVDKTGAVGFLSKLLFIMTYQRSVKVERFTPDISFYGVRKWSEAYDLINQLHQDNSSVAKSDAQLEALQDIQKMLAKGETDEAGAAEAAAAVAAVVAPAAEEAAEESDDPFADLDIDMDLN